MSEDRDALSISLAVKKLIFLNQFIDGSLLEYVGSSKKYPEVRQEQGLTDFYFSTVTESPEAEEALWKSDMHAGGSKRRHRNLTREMSGSFRVE
ncbi:MAG: hypothetical protein V8R91_15185 [Butyricimonas faecihominis]